MSETKNRLTFVYGPSGTGKTSLVQCGLAHRFGGTDWLPLFIRRGEDINMALRQEIGKALGEESYEGEIEEGIQTLYRRFYRPVYLIFDQFEELFILSDPDGEKERLPFYETIADILDAELPCRLLFIMREDYFGHLNEFEQVVPELYHRKIRVEPMNRENLLEVITGSCEVHRIGFGESRKDPGRILDKMQTDKAGTHMPHVQVYLHMLWQEAQKQQGENAQQGITFNKPVIESVGEIKDVLGRFLSEQKVVLQKKLIADGLQPPEEVVATVLDVFVSDDGTKIPIPYTKTADQQNQLTGKFANRLAKLDPRLVAACLNELEYARILRRSEDDYEIAHDTLAAIVDQQRSAEQRQLREVERRIELGYREHQESKQSAQLYFFDAGQLARIEPFLEKATLFPEWELFLADSKKEQHRLVLEKETEQKAKLEAARQRAKKEEGLRANAEKAQTIAEANAKRAKLRTRLAAFLSILALAAAGVALWQYQDAQTKKEEAVAAKDEAVIEKVRADSLATLAHAEAEKAVQSAEAETVALAKADSNLILAKRNEQNAKKSARDAQKALANLQVSNTKSVELILREADRNILQLDYEAAFEKAQAAYELGANLPESKKRLQEIALVYTETEQWGKADSCLQILDISVSNKSRANFIEKIKGINVAYYDFLQKRYYPEMVLVEGGVCELNENYSAQLDNFYLAKTETTNWQYFLFAKAEQREMKSPTWQIWGDNPVIYVDWYDATEYMNWLSEKTGKTKVYEINKIQKDTSNLQNGYRKDEKQWLVKWDTLTTGFRLPTETEWEFAAKGGEKGQTFEYAGSDNLKEVGWYRENSNSRTEPVAKLKPNSLGIYDMSGNVYEWCWDWYGDYEMGMEQNPRGAKNGSFRVVRGGSWSLNAEYSRVSYRYRYIPDDRYDSYGFRLAHSQ